MSQDTDPQDIPTIPIPTLAVVSCHSGVLCTDIGDVCRLLGHATIVLDRARHLTDLAAALRSVADELDQEAKSNE